jgi:uncharacterized DUF497 family protein
MLSSVAGFDWDHGNTEKCCHRGLTVEEIEDLFRGTIDVFPDVAHSIAETRFFAIGQTSAGRHVFVAFTLRANPAGQLIRPISARFMHAKEVKHYAAQIASRQN